MIYYYYTYKEGTALSKEKKLAKKEAKAAKREAKAEKALAKANAKAEKKHAKAYEKFVKETTKKNEKRKRPQAAKHLPPSPFRPSMLSRLRERSKQRRPARRHTLSWSRRSTRRMLSWKRSALRRVNLSFRSPHRLRTRWRQDRRTRAARLP